MVDGATALRGLQYSLKAGAKMLPALLLVFLVIWAFHLARDAKGRLVKLAGRGSGTKGWMIAVTTGILSHGPVYPWYALLRELRQQGVRPALIAAFLYARSIKLPWLPLMAYYFGLAYMVTLTVYIAVFSVLNGWLVEKLAPGDD
ncbi:MAG: permease [Pseudomonadota bacterium]|nr:permease [Pseudomonadota bacterium]